MSVDVNWLEYQLWVPNSLQILQSGSVYWLKEGDSDDDEQKFEEITNRKKEGYKIQARLLYWVSRAQRIYQQITFGVSILFQEYVYVSTSAEFW